MNQDSMNQPPLASSPAVQPSGLGAQSFAQSPIAVAPSAAAPDSVGAAVVSAAGPPTISIDSLVLPAQVISRGDVSKSLREIEAINDYFHQAAIRGSKDQAIPPLGRALDGLATANSLNLLRAEDRHILKTFLTRLKASAPIIHISFPSEANSSFLAKILEWLRTEVHPHAVITVGIQPGLVAGCIIRTTNKTFDFSFRKKFENSKAKLISAIGAEPSGQGAAIAESDTAEQVLSPEPVVSTTSATAPSTMPEVVQADANQNQGLRV